MLKVSKDIKTGKLLKSIFVAATKIQFRSYFHGNGKEKI